MNQAKRLLKTAAGVVASWVTVAMTELLMLAGGVMVTRGAWMLAEAAGWIVGGALALVTGILVARARA
jgi:hypothetical protein